MDFSALFEGWDVSQFLGVEALSLPTAPQQPPSLLPTSTSSSVRQGRGCLEARLSSAAPPSISSLAALTLSTSNNAHSFFQQPRQPAPQLQQYPTRPYVPLPEGWLEIMHQCGMPLYYRSASRVSTWSRPYVSDKQERVRTHKVPISAFPCWDYRRALDEKRESQPEPLSNANMSMNEPKGFAEILSGLEFREKSMMSAEQIHKYCGKRFQFRTVASSAVKSSQAKRVRREILAQKLEGKERETVLGEGLMVAFRRG
ncbi:hypothetical protein RvY_00018 [Ramazzottius varieornatus]|uniref:WW domain-containing protein n=1 Tax=Ramazzottius varieornatus TaxID=947166 RepID=A0A1D1UC66_RAMVA|nr:hypothetical protein RvY_00018 [Ramazzottius varieornatus]